MRVEVIEWVGMPVGKELNLPDDLAKLLIEQGKAKLVEASINAEEAPSNVKISKGSRNKGGDNNLSGGESVAEGDEIE